jgi:hypothetical protein
MNKELKDEEIIQNSKITHICYSRYVKIEAARSSERRPVRESDYSPQSCAEVKNAWSYTSTPPPKSLHGVVLS